MNTPEPAGLPKAGASKAPAPVVQADSDATAARAYAFLAAALARSAEPEREALAAELAVVLGVPTLAVLEGADRHVQVLMQYGFTVEDVTQAIGPDLLRSAMESGLPASVTDAGAVRGNLFGLRSVLIVPVQYAGKRWGALVVGSGVPDAFDARQSARVKAVASGLAVVLAGLSPQGSSQALSRERRLRQGFQGVIEVLSSMVEDATPAAAARSIADELHRQLGWERVLIASHRPALGIVPLAVAGDHVEIHDVIALGTSADASLFVGQDDMPGGNSADDERLAKGNVRPITPMFDGSQSQILFPLGPTGAGITGLLSIESHHPLAFDDVDRELAKAVAALTGPLMARLGLRSERRALAARVDQADRRQRRRFTSLAHELRTPITVILGYADLMVSKDPDLSTRKEYAQTLARHARALGRMVDNALYSWQLDDGALELSLVKVPVRDAVNQAVSELGMSPDLSGVGDAKVLADAFWLPRVIEALLDNARRYVVDGNVRVTTREAGGRVRIAVHDDGPGIDPDDLMHVFDAFHRGEDGAVGPHRGVGLGLTVARALSRAMDGEVEVHSATDYGTTFTIELVSARAGEPT